MRSDQRSEKRIITLYIDNGTMAYDRAVEFLLNLRRQIGLSSVIDQTKQTAARYIDHAEMMSVVPYIHDDGHSVGKVSNRLYSSRNCSLGSIAGTPESSFSLGQSSGLG